MQKITWFILVVFLFLTACEGSNREERNATAPPSADDAVQDVTDKLAVTPLLVENSDQIQFIDWLSNEEVLYIVYKNQESTLFKYDLFSGKKTPLFVTPGFVQLVQVSPERDQLLIQYSSKENEATLTVLNTSSKVTATVTIPSAEIYTNWNQQHLSNILVTAFFEDWSYKSYIWDTATLKLEPIELKQPFAEWAGASSLHYIDWDGNQPSLLGPLKQLQLSGEISTLAEEVYYSKSFGEWYFTLSPSKVSEDKATFQFTATNGKDLGKFDVFHLPSYSGWLIPFYDYTSEKNTFFFFQPVAKGTADVYNQGFLLTSYQVGTNESKILMEGLENLPIECSPNGSYCMYGLQLENMLVMEEQKIIPLIKEGT